LRYDCLSFLEENPCPEIMVPSIYRSAEVEKVPEVFVFSTRGCLLTLFNCAMHFKKQSSKVKK
jgi:hypothetical protein